LKSQLNATIGDFVFNPECFNELNSNEILYIYTFECLESKIEGRSPFDKITYVYHYKNPSDNRTFEKNSMFNLYWI